MSSEPEKLYFITIGEFVPSASVTCSDDLEEARDVVKKLIEEHKDETQNKTIYITEYVNIDGKFIKQDNCLVETYLVPSNNINTN